MAARWVTFDCYGTLADWRTGMSTAVAPLAGADVDHLMAAYYESELAVEHEHPGMRYRDVLAEALRRAAARVDVALPPGGEHVMSERWADMPIFPDVGPALGALRDAGWRLAILTNCDDDLIAVTVERLPAEIDLVVTAEQVGSYKPAPGHWRRFAELVPDRAAWVHAANSWVHDIRTATELGVPSVWVDRDRSGHDPAIAGAVLHDLEELPEAVQSVAAGPGLRSAS